MDVAVRVTTGVPTMTGGSRGTCPDAVAGLGGETSIPPDWSVASSRMVAASVPAWNAGVSSNTAWVVFAGMRKLTVLVPLANTTCGSATPTDASGDPESAG